MALIQKQKGFFRLSRSTLWMLIFILIPLIVVLNKTGQTQPDENIALIPDEEMPGAFDLPSVAPHHQDQLWWVSLPGSQLVLISVVQDRRPLRLPEAPQTEDFNFSFLNGYAVSSLKLSNEKGVLDGAMEFLLAWLPPLKPDDMVVISGEVDEALAAKIGEILTSASGDALEPEIPQPEAGLVVPVSEIGSNGHMAMLMAANILSSRLAGRAPEIRWDHENSQSYLLLDGVTGTAELKSPSPAELRGARAAFAKMASLVQRTPEQIHHYLLASAVNHLPVDFMKTQYERVQSVTDDEIIRAFAQLRQAERNHEQTQ